VDCGIFIWCKGVFGVQRRLFSSFCTRMVDWHEDGLTLTRGRVDWHEDGLTDEDGLTGHEDGLTGHEDGLTGHEDGLTRHEDGLTLVRGRVDVPSVSPTANVILVRFS
jgi:hypothetical protein